MGLFTYLRESLTPGRAPYPSRAEHFGADRGVHSNEIRNDCNITDAEVRDALHVMQSDLNKFPIGSVWTDYDRRARVQPENVVGEDIADAGGRRKKINLHLTERCDVDVGPVLTESVEVDRVEEVVVTWGERATNEPEPVLVSWPAAGDALPAVPRARESRVALPLAEGWKKTKADYSQAASSAFTATMSALKSAEKVATRVQKSVVATAERLIEDHIPVSVQAWGKSVSSLFFGDYTIREVDILATDRDPVV